MNVTGYELIWLFFIYSFAGWCLEVAVAAVKQRKFVNKGFLNSPFCTIYGFGAVAFAIFLPELEHRIVFLFIGGGILASFIEYLAGRILEWIFHRKWWDHSKEKFQLDGYVSLKYAAIWGACTVVSIKFINPLIYRMVGMIPSSVGKIVLWILAGIILLDIAGSATAVTELHNRLGKLTQFNEDLQHLSDSLGNVITRRIQKRMMHAFPNISLQNLVEEAKKRRAKAKAETTFAVGCSFYKLASLFFIGAFLGDITETIFCYVKAGVLMSRSSVFYGPFSIVWGLGCVMLTVALYRYRESDDRHIFLAGTVLGGAYEYFCSVFTERVFGTIFWDYSRIPFNLGGRINLLYCFFWGIVSVVWLKLIYPKLSELIEKIPVRVGKIACNILIVFMIFNMAISGMALSRFMERHHNSTKTGPVETFLDTHYPDSRVLKVYPDMKIVEK